MNQQQRIKPTQMKKKSNTAAGCLLLPLVLIILILGGGFLAVNWYQDIASSPNSQSKDEAIIEVKEGDNINTIAAQLQEAGVIRNDLVLKVYVKANNVSANIKPGKYKIAKNLTMDQVIKILEKGELKPSISLSLREGLKYEETADLVDKAFKNYFTSNPSEQNKFDKSNFIEICQNPDRFSFSEETKNFLNKYKPSGKPLRGFLYPDTYSFDYDSTAMEVIDTMVLNLQKRLKENNVDLDNISAKQKQIKNLYEALTLASIIQIESGNANDDPKVSSVFHNRLADNYPLQSDATVNFALNNKTLNISIQDTKVDSPYNTYKYSGLTPTPVNEPGIKAIIAAINPADTQYFFFLYDTKGNGYFAVTYAEHQRNVARYL